MPLNQGIRKVARAHSDTFSCSEHFPFRASSSPTFKRFVCSPSLPIADKVLLGQSTLRIFATPYSRWSNFGIVLLAAMTRGNQRDLAREKNQKKQLELQRKKGSSQKDGNKGMTLEERRQRDADQMRLKQQKAEQKKTLDCK
ncbi:uncharacterized protein LOC111263952 [Varroa jacobsoni]|uniref:Small EDRK-rich factor-like N-terminal domain-containing protein n=1 Tax=Varroa destructor TaxID=109461 RepID=A0A7M7JQ60_VARDE|nr:uncharacterized protein LOC111248054 [Varroa destructor]XP_022695227.1 uncharacterized protein LOC111263952 [Varroa jacobsoni]